MATKAIRIVVAVCECGAIGASTTEGFAMEELYDQHPEDCDQEVTHFVWITADVPIPTRSVAPEVVGTLETEETTVLEHCNTIEEEVAQVQQLHNAYRKHHMLSGSYPSSLRDWIRIQMNRNKGTQRGAMFVRAFEYLTAQDRKSARSS